MPSERRRGWTAGFVAAALAAGPLAAAGGDDDLRPSWECLPAETVAMVRLPRAEAFLATLRDTTRFGAVALRRDRLEGLWELLVEQSERSSTAADSAAAGLTWDESLEKYGLEPGDPTAIFSGDVGGGLVVLPRDGLTPLTMLLAWGEPGAEVAGRLLAAVRRRLEDAAEAEGPAPRRIDLELAGHEVVSVVVPVMGIDTSGIDLEVPDEPGQDGDGEDLAARLARLRDRLDQAEPVQTGQTHVFHAVLGGRFLYATTFPAAAGDQAAQDFEATSGGDEAREIFAAFLAAHQGDAEPPLARVLQEPALAAANPAGVPLVEAVVLPRQLLAVAGEGGDPVATQLEPLGLDDIGGLVWRQAFDDGRWRSMIAATLPAPRHGLLAMLDQPCDGCEVPPFVTREAIDFTQISLDLGRAFAGVREALLAEDGAEQLANMFDVADVQSTTWLGADVATILSGLGSRHWLLSFPPRIAEAVAKARVAVQVGDATSFQLPETDSIALVWQVADEAPLLKLLGRLAPLAGGELQEEQGFRGVRLPEDAGGAFVGRGHLVLAAGEGTLEKVLTAIRNPPAGDTSWRESEALARARQLIDLPAARMFGVSDARRTGGMLGAVRDYAAALEPDDVAEELRKLLAAGQKLLPTAAEMEGMFGVGASVLRMTDDGLLYESAWEMPPP
jgi:hypothetical protein